MNTEDDRPNPPPQPGFPPPPAASGTTEVPSPSTGTVKRWSTGQLGAVAVVALLLGLGIGAAAASGGDEAGKEEEAASTSSTVASTTTERERTTTTTAPTTTSTTAAPTTTTTAAPTPESVAAAFPSQFEATRSELIDVLESDRNVQSVDRFEYDPAQGAVILAVTSTWASPDNQDEGAWELTRAMAALWEPTNGLWHDPTWSPALQLVNSGRYRNCTGEFMVLLADRRASQADWRANCG